MNTENTRRLEQSSLSKLNLQLNNNRIALSTLTTILRHLKTFRRYLNEEKEVIISNEDELLKYLKTTDIEKLLIDYMSYLNSNNLTPSTIRGRIHSILKLLRINNVKFDWNNFRDNYLPEKRTIVSEDKIPSKEELRLLFDSRINLKDRCFIELAIHGLRSGTIRTLKWYEVNLNWRNDLGLITIHRFDKHNRLIEGRKMKKLNRYCVPLTRECVKYLERYKIEREMKGEVITEDSYVITSESRLGYQVTDGYFSNRWNKILKQLRMRKVISNNIKTQSAIRYDLHLHSLRKFFRTMCSNARVRNSFRELWLGHKGKGHADAYERFKGNEDEHLNDFLLLEPLISIHSQSQLNSIEARQQLGNKKIQNLETELTKLREIVLGYEKMFKIEVNGEKTDLRPKRLRAETSEPSIVKVSKRDVDKYIELRGKGYVKTMENYEYIVMEKT